MSFNWQAFLDQHNIPYTDKGRNVSRGNLALKCPFCGENDPSMHMNVSLLGRGYACWREAEHRGRNEAYLVHALLGIPLREARRIVYGEDDYIPTDEDFIEEIERLLGERPERSTRASLDIPDDWRRLYGESSNKSPARLVVFQYLTSRGYPIHDAEAIAHRYNLHYALREPWARRVIFPIYDDKGNVVNFTGRAISKQSRIRYKTLTGEHAVNRMSQCILDYQRLVKTKGSVLVVCEGPFDALRITWMGEPFGIYATCVFTQNVSDGQAEKLQRIAPNFSRKVVLFDRGAEMQAIRAQFQLNFERVELPESYDVGDPGELTGNQALMFCRSLLGGFDADTGVWW